MLQKITQLPKNMYFSFFGMVRRLKEDERGLSGVVVAILLILVAVLAIVLIWGLLGNWLRELWDQITTQGTQIQ